MDSLDELEVMFQHINVAGLSSVIPGVQKTTAPIDVDDDSNDNEDNGHTGQDAKKEGKHKANAVDNPFSPKKKGRNPMVKQVSRVLLHIPSFPVEKQKKIIIACMALHNFIRDSALSDELFQMCDEDEEYMPEVDSSEEEEEVHNSGPSSDDVDMCAFRDFIANSLMADRG